MRKYRTDLGASAMAVAGGMAPVRGPGRANTCQLWSRMPGADGGSIVRQPVKEPLVLRDPMQLLHSQVSRALASRDRGVGQYEYRGLRSSEVHCEGNMKYTGGVGGSSI